MDGEGLMFYSQISSPNYDQPKNLPAPCPLSGVLQDYLGCHRPLLAHHWDDSGWISPWEQVRLGESQWALSLLPVDFFFFTVTCRFFLMKPYIFSGFLPVWRAGWASWCTWPATGSVLEACQPPSTITTGQFKPSVCTWSQDSLTKARSVCPTEKTNPEKEEYVSPITPRPSTLWFWPTMAATPWWVSLIVGPATLVSDFWTCCANASLVGGSDPRGSDGSHPEVHGEGLSSCLVWEVRDEGQTCRNQQVWCKSRSS